MPLVNNKLLVSSDREVYLTHFGRAEGRRDAAFGQNRIHPAGDNTDNAGYDKLGAGA